METRLVTAIDELEALVEPWDALWRRSPSATPFQSPAWLAPWFRTFSPGELHCAAAFARGELVALAPFYLERSPFRRRLMPLGVSLSDYLDMLVDPRAPEAATAITSALCAAQWDEWRFEALAPDAEALRLAPPCGVEDASSEQERCPLIISRGAPLPDCVPARQRRKLRRARAAAARLGGFAVTSDSSPEEFLSGLFDLHGRRWGGRGESGVLADPAVQSFHRAALPALKAAGVARTLTVSIAGRAAGAYYGFTHRGRAYAYLGGFDPAFEEASPGALAIEAALEQAADEGVAEFHFLRGAEKYKYDWGAQDRWNRIRIWTRSDV